MRDPADAASASARWRSRRPGPTSGSARPRTATSRPPAATPAAASSTATTPRWREVRDETKYGRMIAFGEALPQIRARVEADLAQPRPAAREGARRGGAPARDDADPRRQRGVRPQNGSFGLTTLRNRHVDVDGVDAALRASAARAARTIAIECRTGAWRASSALPGPARPGALPVPRRGRRARSDQLRRRQRLPARDHRRGLHRQGLPHLGRHGARRAGAPEAGACESGEGGQEGRGRGTIKRSRSTSATGRRSAASTTSTRRSSRPSSRASWKRRWRGPSRIRPDDSGGLRKLEAQVLSLLRGQRQATVN